MAHWPPGGGGRGGQEGPLSKQTGETMESGLLCVAGPMHLPPFNSIAAARRLSSTIFASPLLRPAIRKGFYLPSPLPPPCSHRRQAMGSAVSASAGGASGAQTDPPNFYTDLSDEEWQKRLTKEQYMITRKKGTERAFTGEYWNTKTPGVYECRCCGTPLFDSSTKFDSGTGWPSYYAPISNNVKSEMDWSIPFMPRTEVLCARCNAHLGHVFNDGPPPTGKRYCINSASLNLKPR